MTHGPGYIDLQVNGYGGVDFNADGLQADDLSAACARLRDDGVAGVLATVITDSLETMERRLRRLAALRGADPLAREMIAGIHIEGPFLNETPGCVGAHPPAAVRPAEVDAADRLIEAAGGLCRLFTLAPERDRDFRVTRRLIEQGVVVSAGHCDPTLDVLRAAVDAGLSMFTHLGNGCAAAQPRHDNIVQRALSLSDRLWCCFIADGVHVPFFALRNYLRATGIERAIVVTDAISAAGMGPGRYTLGDQPIEVGRDLAARFPDDDTHLAGSAVTLPRTAENLRAALGLDRNAIERLAVINPRRALGL